MTTPPTTPSVPLADLPQHSWVWFREGVGERERVGRLLSASPELLGNVRLYSPLSNFDVLTPEWHVWPLDPDEVHQAETYDWGIDVLERAAADSPAGGERRSRARVTAP